MSKNIGKVYTYYDLMFKRMFGDKRNINILRNFLTDGLKLEKDDISEIEFIEPSSRLDKIDTKEKTNDENDEKTEKTNDKITQLDIKCTTKTGRIIGIEIQVQRDSTMRSRAIFSNAKNIVQQLTAGDLYSKLKEVITVVITIDHIMITECDDYKYCYIQYDPEHRIALSNLSRIMFLEYKNLPKNLDKIEGTEEEDLVYWMKFIGSSSEEEMKMLASKNTGIAEAFDLYKELNADAAFREEVWRHQEAIIRQNSRIDDARREGKAERETEIARMLLKRGRLTVEEISEDTGLPISEIEKLRY